MREWKLWTEQKASLSHMLKMLWFLGIDKPSETLRKEERRRGLSAGRDKEEEKECWAWHFPSACSTCSDTDWHKEYLKPFCCCHHHLQANKAQSCCHHILQQLGVASKGAERGENKAEANGSTTFRSFVTCFDWSCYALADVKDDNRLILARVSIPAYCKDHTRNKCIYF